MMYLKTLLLSFTLGLLPIIAMAGSGHDHGHGHGHTPAPVTQEIAKENAVLSQTQFPAFKNTNPDFDLYS